MKKIIKKAPELEDNFISPKAITVYEKETVTFEAEPVSGIPPFYYQWYFNNVELKDETDSKLIIVNAKNKQSGRYNVIIKNRFGKIKSNDSYLIVFPKKSVVEVEVVPPVPTGTNWESVTANWESV